MKLNYRKALLVVMDWTRKLFFACVFATLLSFWSAKWEDAQEKNRISDCRSPANKALKSSGGRK